MIQQYASGSSGSIFTFANTDLHGDVVSQGNFEPEVIPEKYFGVEGESHLIGAKGGRDLTAEFWLTGFATAALLGTGMQTIAAQIGLLTGSIVLSGNIVSQFNNCTFLGFHPGARFYDGAGNLLWCVTGQLIWRQRKP